MSQIKASQLPLWDIFLFTEHLPFIPHCSSTCINYRMHPRAFLGPILYIAFIQSVDTRKETSRRQGLCDHEISDILGGTRNQRTTTAYKWECGAHGARRTLCERVHPSSALGQSQVDTSSRSCQTWLRQVEGGEHVIKVYSVHSVLPPN